MHVACHKEVTAPKVTKVSEATRKDDCLSPRKTKRVDVCSEFSEPESVEAKSVELCEGESSDSLCHTLFSSTTSPLTTAVVEEVETPSCSLMLSVLTDQGVGEFVAQPLPEVRVPAGCEVNTRRTVRANSADQSFDFSVPTRLKDSSQIQTNGDNSVVKFNAWLINMLLFDYLNCMLFLIVAFIRSLRERLLTLPLLHRLRLQRGCKLFSAMGSPPPLIIHNPRRCEFVGGSLTCLDDSTSETPCCASGRCGEHSHKKYACGCWLTQAIHASKRRCGSPETSIINANAEKCDMATKPLHPDCVDCQSGILCFQHMGICQKTAFTACVLCSKLKCHDTRCLEKICCEESYVQMILALEACEKEDLATKSKMSPLTDDALSMLPLRVVNNYAVLCQSAKRCLPAAPAAVTATILNDQKTDAESSKILNEERKQVTAHTTPTQNASTNDCVRYFDIGKRKKEETIPVCSDLRVMTSVEKEISESKQERIAKK